MLDSYVLMIQFIKAWSSNPQTHCYRLLLNLLNLNFLAYLLLLISYCRYLRCNVLLSKSCCSSCVDLNVVNWPYFIRLTLPMEEHLFKRIGRIRFHVIFLFYALSVMLHASLATTVARGCTMSVWLLMKYSLRFIYQHTKTILNVFVLSTKQLDFVIIL